VNAFVLIFCVAAVSFVQFSGPANAVVAGLFAMVGLYVLRNAWVFCQTYIQHPYFRVQILPGQQLTLRTRRRELRISSSRVAGYYIYNNKIVLRLHEPIRERGVPPYAKVRGRSVTIYFYFLKDTAEFLRGLRAFDDAFSEKLGVNAGMLVQALGQGLA
jgi:hypothetical protein